jgi:hypothetical protein
MTETSDRQSTRLGASGEFVGSFPDHLAQIPHQHPSLHKTDLTRRKLFPDANKKEQHDASF